MKFGVYCIRDIKAHWLTPTIDENDATASRNFVHATMNSNSLLHTHAKDFDLFRIGEFDNESGLMTSYDHTTLVFEGSAVEEVK